MFDNINFKKPWKEITPINKGWSNDNKYHFIACDGEEYLLRISNIKQYDQKLKQYENQKQIKTLNINASIPVAFGILNENEIYTILTWIRGEDAQTVIPKLKKEEQYVLGMEAGKILKKIHSLAINQKNEITWWERYQNKIARKIEKINSCEIELPNKEIIFNYVKENMELVKDHSLTYTHGDFHVGNMIVNNQGIGIIDFDRSDIADFYDDFKPFCWNVFISPIFETGIIDGYFENIIPKDFFKILSLYAAESILSGLPWAINFGEEEVKTQLKVITKTLEWFDNFNKIIPSWYYHDFN